MRHHRPLVDTRCSSTASAVVCDTGAMQSHASIVARELGIPAVMSVPGITSVADGTMLQVDGDRGIVTIG